MSGLVQMGRHAGEQKFEEEEIPAVMETVGLVTAYLTKVLAQEVGGRMPMRAERELRTLSEAIDGLVRGKVQTVGDILMQRFRVVKCRCWRRGVGVWEGIWR